MTHAVFATVIRMAVRQGAIRRRFRHRCLRCGRSGRLNTAGAVADAESWAIEALRPNTVAAMTAADVAVVVLVAVQDAVYRRIRRRIRGRRGVESCKSAGK